MNALIPLVWFAALGALFFVLIVLPQRRKMQAFYAMQSSVRVGDEILTTSGLHGTVRALGDDDLDLEIAPGVVVRFARQAIGRVVTERTELDLTTDPGDPGASGVSGDLGDPGQGSNDAEHGVDAPGAAGSSDMEPRS